MARHPRLTDAAFVHKHGQAQSVSELAQLCGCSAQWASKRMLQMGLPLYNGKRPKRKHPKPYDPTPEEIAEKCKAIQATWTPQSKRHHTVQPNPEVELFEITPVF